MEAEEDDGLSLKVMELYNKISKKAPEEYEQEFLSIIADFMDSEVGLINEVKEELTFSFICGERTEEEKLYFSAAKAIYCIYHIYNFEDEETESHAGVFAEKYLKECSEGFRRLKPDELRAKINLYASIIKEWEDEKNKGTKRYIMSETTEDERTKLKEKVGRMITIAADSIEKGDNSSFENEFLTLYRMFLRIYP